MTDTTHSIRSPVRFASGFLLAAFIAFGGAAARAENPDRQVFDLHIENDRLAQAQKVIRVRKGDVVELRWTADKPTAIHVHGYDLRARAVPNAAEKTVFEARATGRFPATIHGKGGKHVTLFYLEVHPD